jgi:hypothetical protein
VSCITSHNHDGIITAINFVQADRDIFAGGGWDVLADKIRANGQLTVPSVDEHCQLNALWAPQIGQGIECCANGTPREEHIVDEDDRFPCDIDRDAGVLDFAGRPTELEIITVQRDVEGTYGQFTAFDLFDCRSDTFGEGDATPIDADEYHVVHSVVAFTDFVPNARNGTTYLIGCEDLAFVHELLHA